jgi:hypothetical protein
VAFQNAFGLLPVSKIPDEEKWRMVVFRSGEEFGRLQERLVSSQNGRWCEKKGRMRREENQKPTFSGCHLTTLVPPSPPKLP